LNFFFNLLTILLSPREQARCLAHRERETNALQWDCLLLLFQTLFCTVRLIGLQCFLLLVFKKNYGIALQSDQLDFAFLCSFQDTKCSLVLMFLFFQLLLPNLHCFRTPEIAATLCLVDFLCFDSGLGISDIFRWLSDLKMYFPLTFSCYFVLSRISALFCGFKVFYPLGFCSDFAVSRNS
jgi:hypothetical protein